MWFEITEALPILEYLYPQYLPTDQRAFSYTPCVVRAAVPDEDWYEPRDEYLFSTAWLRHMWDAKLGGWTLFWDCDNNELHGREDTITHWMPLT